jgi:acyl-CoA synthetase (AMP-forming)/AMP-acid ligase II
VATALQRSRRLVLPEVIGRGRRAHPDRAALVFGDAERTHAALHERAERLATVLVQAGVRRRDRVRRFI